MLLWSALLLCYMKCIVMKENVGSNNYRSLSSVVPNKKYRLLLNSHLNNGEQTYEGKFSFNVEVLSYAIHREESNNHRLPTSVVPTNYRLLLNPHLDRGGKTYDGELTIKVEVHTPTSTIYLHTRKLYYTQISLSGISGNIPITHEIVEDSREFLIIRSGTVLPIGEYTLNFIFGGRLDGHKVGLYASSSNQKMTVGSTFEPLNAREAFPCFDEPNFKATYDVSLVKPSNYIALSNMNEISSAANPGSDTDTVTFAPSVPMSTYLACFVVCDYQFKEVTIDTHGIGPRFNLRCYASDTEKITFALDFGKRATEFYIRYFKVPYPLPKLDMITIPDCRGAIETWGLIIFNEILFVIDIATSSTSNKIKVATIVAHELAHMWFGNLVTMKWWDELWLKEGFAKFLENKALKAIEPSWTMIDQFQKMIIHPTLLYDSKLASHQIIQNVTTPDEINGMFDEVSYNKGASILRMFEGFIGSSNFQQGVTDYLNKHKFGNTVTQDLLDSLEPYFQQTHPHLNLRHILDTWTNQMGYPLVTITHGPHAHTYTLTQTRFLDDQGAQDKETSPFNYRWAIPITYQTMQGAHNEVLWFANTDDSVTITLKKKDIWLKVNNDQVGYYRVNYPQEMWMNLIDQLQTQPDRFSIFDRAHLLNDVYALASARIVSYELALQLTTYLPYEEEYIPWSVAEAIFEELDENLSHSAAHLDFQEFVQKLIAPIYETISWERQFDSTDSQSLLRSTVLKMSCKYALADARQRARQIFLDWLDNHGTMNEHFVEPDLRDIVYYYGMKQATSDEWDHLWQIYLAEEDAQERIKLLQALAAPEDPTILTRYLTLSRSNIRDKVLTISVVAFISGNPAGRALLWEYVRAHWTDYMDRIHSVDRSLLLSLITAKFYTQERLDEMEAFIALHPVTHSPGKLGRRAALEKVRNNIQWTQHNQPVIASWLSKHLHVAWTS